ncbi:hypothetical protein L2E82_45767 [Cichorium intybus]|uniref:Uncharacterized protein n=1 Tax=Cichorium intybus TaxID=13427 RepID=A0ACB8ZSY1_CICIN|nr:hypothetical protein L2E82_45767 [Cichorium intybus]
MRLVPPDPSIPPPIWLKHIFFSDQTDSHISTTFFFSDQTTSTTFFFSDQTDRHILHRSVPDLFTQTRGKADEKLSLNLLETSEARLIETGHNLANKKTNQCSINFVRK